ncbi:MAG: DUF362 domain-containing protein [Armatimonadota bacterium]
MSRYTSSVAVVKAGSRLLPAVDDAMEAAGLGDCVGRGERVLVKPNLHGGDGHTSEALMAAACRWAFDKGARQVLLGDGAYWGIVDSHSYFENCGVFRACAATGALPVDLHDHPFKLHHPGVEGVPTVIGVSRHLYECDSVINLPVMKTHFNTLITIALKNIKGCLRRVDKRRFHECDIPRAVGVANQIIRPLIRANLCDATTAYEGLGPGEGTPVPLGLLLASADPVALDTVCCQLMQIDPRKVQLIEECAKRGVGESDPALIEVIGEALEDHARRFQRPHEALAEAFPGLDVQSAKACSCCMQNLFLALRRVNEEGKKPGCRSVRIGPGEDSEVELLVGNCAAAGMPRPVDAPGCPPDVNAIYEQIVNAR